MGIITYFRVSKTIMIIIIYLLAKSYSAIHRNILDKIRISFPIWKFSTICKMMEDFCLQNDNVKKIGHANKGSEGENRCWLRKGLQ